MLPREELFFAKMAYPRSEMDLFWEVFFCPPSSSRKPITKLVHFGRASFASFVFNRLLELISCFTIMTLHML